MTTSQDRDDVDLAKIASNMNKSEELDDTPQATEIRRATEDDQLGAAAQEDGQTPQVCLNVVLVNAALVEPNVGSALPALLELGLPPAQRFLRDFRTS